MSSCTNALLSPPLQQRLDSEFPVANEVPADTHRFSPSTIQPSTVFQFPGVTQESTSVVRGLMEENDRRFHIYQRISFQHNHLPHHLLTAYSLGATPKHLQAIFEDNVDDMAPIDRDAASSKSAGEAKRGLRIDSTNWDSEELLGKKRFAQAAVHSPDLVSPLFPPDWPNTVEAAPSSVSSNSAQPAAATIANTVKDAFSSLSISNAFPSFTTGSPRTGSPDRDRARNLIHPGLLELYAELCGNDKLHPGPYNPDLTIDKRLRDAVAGGRAGEMQKIADKWGVGEEELVEEEGGKGGIASGWARRVEELQVLGTLLAAATGRVGREPRVDFFLMHCLTSSIFLPSFMQYLQPGQRAVLLKSYLLVVFHTALSRGRPLIRPEVLSKYPVDPSPPSRAVKSGGNGSGSASEGNQEDVVGDPAAGGYGNPWLAVVDNCMYSKDSHVMKSIRSLLLYSMKYGHLPPGHLLGSHRRATGGGEESIPGISALGGDIFVRAAGMIMHVMGWARERKPGEKEGSWDMSALGWDEVWK
ncbi:hypothetical protein QFC21_005261 [Naganishia friedmannii]|uniref:Uncharacterized protein n=1 Tax=Naganishia friedmannii TaxID=89922 RepID=A0ACC2VB92_9TREE|nr:hypothetical protein QFC21_005261 [Naganishia friedmannii]